MLRAVTSIGKSKAYVDKDTAFQKGKCRICGVRFDQHPRGLDGKLEIDRHHEVNQSVRLAYEIATGKPYPTNTQNLFWTARPCHRGFHDYVVGLRGYKKAEKQFKATNAKIKDRRKLVQVLEAVSDAHKAPINLTPPEQEAIRAFLKFLDNAYFAYQQRISLRPLAAILGGD